MSLETKLLLADLAELGASVVLKDGSPRLIGGEKVPPEMKSLLKANREEIIALLTPPPPKEKPSEYLFGDPDDEIPENSSLDVVGRKEKTLLRKKFIEAEDESDIVLTAYCSMCFNLVEGRFRRGGNVFGAHALQVIFQDWDTKKWICYACESLKSERGRLEAQKRLVAEQEELFLSRIKPENREKSGQEIGKKNYYTGAKIA